MLSKISICLATVAALSGCAVGPGVQNGPGVSADQSSSSYADALNLMRQICVDTGPDFTSARTVIASFGGRPVGGSGTAWRDYAMPGGDVVRLARRPQSNECTYFRHGPETMDQITGAESAQPGFQQHPAVERIGPPNGPFAMFHTTYRIPQRGLYLTITPPGTFYSLPPRSSDKASTLSTYIFLQEGPGDLNTSPGGQLAVVELK